MASGDAFVSAFTVALYEGCTACEAVAFEAVAAAVAMTRVGTPPSLPNRQDVGGGLGRETGKDSDRESRGPYLSD